MPVIAISPYSKFNEDTISIGVNCIGKENIQKARKLKLQIINPYKDHDDLLNAAEYCWSVSMDCCGHIGKALNRIHGVSYTPTYWKVLLLPWMFAFVENLYDRYLRLCLVRENYPNAVIEIPEVEWLNPLYNKSLNVWVDPSPHLTNVKIYTFMISAMGLESNAKYLDINIDNVKQEMSYFKNTNNVQDIFKKIIGSLITTVRRHKENVVFFENSPKINIELFTVSKKLGWLQLGWPYIKEKGFDKQVIDRNEIKLEYTGDEFKKILRNFINWTLPVSLFEEYHGRRQTAITWLNRKKIETMFVSNNFWANDTLKFLLAEVKERGGRIIGRQHGGGYGHYVIAPCEKVEREIFDSFVTWGWTDDKRCSTIPLPDPRLSNLANIHNKKTKNILFMGSHAPMYMFRYQSYWVPEFVYSKYYSMKQMFFEGLKESAKKSILYRPYVCDYGWNEKEKIKEMLPYVRFATSSSLINYMRDSSIVVIDHPSTSFLEALVVNIPTILFWDDNQCSMREEAKPYFQLLRDAGILHYDAVNASKKVNEIEEEPGIWWSSEIVQSARQEFCGRFARTSSNWKNIWVSTLKPFIHAKGIK